MRKYTALLLLPSICVSQLLSCVPSLAQDAAEKQSTEQASSARQKYQPSTIDTPYVLGSKNICGSDDTAENLPSKAKPTPGKASSAPENIALSHLKIFDDSTLQQQLFLNYSRISNLSGFDQTSLTNHLGNISGINQSFVNTGINLGGPATSQQVSSNFSSNSTTTLTGTTGTPNEQQTTVNSAAVPTSNVAAAPTAVTSGPVVQSQAIFTEQTQLAARLSTELLETEGALSDRLMTYPTKDSSGGEHRVTLVRPRMTFGFEVTLQPTEREKDQVAVVEEIISSCPGFSINSPPSVTALLPAETTFNVANVTSKSTNLGAGFATALLGASGGIGFGHNSYYLGQDQDTLAQVFDPVDPDNPSQPDPACHNRPCIGVRWIFKPVLGKRFVQPNRRVLAAQFDFPTPLAEDNFMYAAADVRTYWCAYDRKNGIVKKLITSKLKERYTVPLRQLEFSNIRDQNELNDENLEDLGNGQMKVNIHTSYLPGTIVRIGTNLITSAANGLFLATNQFSFIAPASDILGKQAFIVFPNGVERPIQLHPAAETPMIWAAKTPLTVTTLDSSHSLLHVSYCSYLGTGPHAHELLYRVDRPLLLVASHTYGLSDSPYSVATTDPQADDCSPEPANAKPAGPYALKLFTISQNLPTSTLIASPNILLKRPFGRSDDTLHLSLFGTSQNGVFSLLSQPGNIALFSQTETGADFLLYGNRLSNATLVQPASPLFQLPGTPNGFASEVRLFSLTNDQINEFKFVVLSRPGEAPEVLTMPAVKIDAGGGDGPNISTVVLVGDDTATLSGVKIDKIEKIEFNKKRIDFKPGNGSSITLTGLKAAGVTSQASLQKLDIYLKKRTPIKVPIDVFTQKTQTVARDTPKPK